jgi:hypothetical protein
MEPRERKLEKINEELHTFYSSPYRFRVIQLRGMRWVGHAAFVGKMRNCYRLWSQKLKEICYLIDLGTDMRTIAC